MLWHDQEVNLWETKDSRNSGWGIVDLSAGYSHRTTMYLFLSGTSKIEGLGF